MEWSQKAYLRFSDPIIQILSRTKITPNALTIFNIALTLTAGVWFFSRGTWQGYALGLLVMLINGFIDYVDGDLAKKTGRVTALGMWLDSGFDVILQNIIMASIGLGCFKEGMGIIFLVLFFVGNTSCNFVAYKYNDSFGFSSYDGNALFRKYMDEKPTLINRFLKNVIDPTSSGVGLVAFTVRYWIAIGALANVMPASFIVITLLTNIRWAIMFVIFAFHQCKYKKLWVSQALAIIDEERDEFYRARIRSHQEV